MIVVDAAERTGCAIGTLKSRVHRARLHLREHAASPSSGGAEQGYEIQPCRRETSAPTPNNRKG
jgi:hypothetical protein